MELCSEWHDLDRCFRYCTEESVQGRATPDQLPSGPRRLAEYDVSHLHVALARWDPRRAAGRLRGYL